MNPFGPPALSSTTPSASLFGVVALCGFVAGLLASVVAANSVDPAVPNGLRNCACGRSRRIRSQITAVAVRVPCPACASHWSLWPLLVCFSSAVGFAAFAWLLIQAGCQVVAEVQPSQPVWANRLPFQLLFLTLLLTATLTDLLDYSIPDLVVLPGAVLAVLFACLSGELQVIHVWVDWDYELVQLYGPYLPDWMKHHQHLHGLAWSMAGLLLGGGLMWLARVTAHTILGVPAIGLGDVTLMAMIGAFLGWQPTLCTLAVSPLAGLALGPAGRIISGRSFVAFGPYLCAGAVVVLCCWKWLWEDLRLKIIFSHWPTICAMIAGTFVVYCVLLVLLRWFLAVDPRQLR